MLNAQLSLITLNLRTMLRRHTVHLIRCLFLALLYLVTTQMLDQQFSASNGGVEFLIQLAELGYFVTGLMTFGYLVPVIPQSRKSGEFDLLILSPHSASSVIHGLWGARFVTLLMILIVQMPFAVLALNLGDVQIEQVIFAIGLSATTCFMVAFLSLLCSIQTSSSFRAMAVLSAALTIYETAPIWCPSLFHSLTDGMYATRSYFPTEMTSSRLLRHVLGGELRVTVCLGVMFGQILFCLLIYGFAWARVAASSNSESTALSRRPGGMAPGLPVRRPMSSIALHSYYYRAGGVVGLLFRTAVVLAILAFFQFQLIDGLGLNTLLFGGQAYTLKLFGLSIKRYSSFFIFFACLLFLVLDCLWLYCRFIFHEVNNKTFSAFELIPRSLLSKCLSVFGGFALAQTPIWILLICRLFGDSYHILTSLAFKQGMIIAPVYAGVIFGFAFATITARYSDIGAVCAGLIAGLLLIYLTYYHPILLLHVQFVTLIVMFNIGLSKPKKRDWVLFPPSPNFSTLKFIVAGLFAVFTVISVFCAIELALHYAEINKDSMLRLLAVSVIIGFLVLNLTFLLKDQLSLWGLFLLACAIISILFPQMAWLLRAGILKLDHWALVWAGLGNSLILVLTTFIARQLVLKTRDDLIGE